MGIVLTKFFDIFHLPKISAEDWIRYIIGFLSPVVVFLSLSQSTILGVILSIIVGFMISFGILFQKCKSSSKDPDYKKISKLSTATTSILLIYAILYSIAPYLQKTPVTKIIGVLIQSILGAIITGIVVVITIGIIVKKASYCIDKQV